MGIYIPDPRPVQLGRSNSTLPVPHVPIADQGDQPPRRQVATALLLATIVGLWPATTLDPVLGAPNNARVKIAPLTLATGDQPPVVGHSRTVTRAALDWPPDFVPTQRTPMYAATLSPPILTFPYARVPAHVYAAWQPPDPAPVQRLRSFVPTLATVDQPPAQRRSPLLQQIAATWAQTWDAQRAAPAAAWNVVIAGYLPPARSPLLQIVATWADPLITPRAGPSASWIVSVVVTTTPRTVQLVASRSNTIALDASVSAPALSASRSTAPTLDASVSAPTLTASRSNTVNLDASE